MSELHQYRTEKDAWYMVNQVPGGLFFFTRHRCSSINHHMRCQLENGHSGDHRGWTKGYPEVTWTTSARPIPKKADKAFAGWRTWRLRHFGDEGYFIASISAPAVWLTPRMTTRYGEMVRCGDYSGDLGIYSYKDPEVMLEELDIGVYPVIGKIDNLGHVVEHEYGWRSQIAVVRELWVVRELLPVDAEPSIIRDLETRYHCPANALEGKQLRHWARWYSQAQKEEK